MGNDVSKQISDGLDDFARGVEDVGKQISEGVGAVGQSIGDTFYYDNPNRRDRVEQLRNDINTFKAEFDSLKKRADEVVAGLQPKVDKLLRDNGFESADDMDRKMKDRLDPEALKKWEEFKKMLVFASSSACYSLINCKILSLNRDIAIENIIFAVTGILTVATGVISGILIVFGVITAATGGLALEALGVAALALGAVVVILALVDASEERDLLKELDDVRTGGSWRDEDPDVGPVPAGKEDSVQRSLDKIRAEKTSKDAGHHVSLLMATKPAVLPVNQAFDMRTGRPIIQFVHDKSMPGEIVQPQEFQLTSVQSRVDCEAEEVHTGDKWLIHANVTQPYPEKINVKDVKFTMNNVTKGKIFTGCQWQLHGYRTL
ncbi:hypothetical protein PG993_013152 [Apiospora rasikravindrae]|uniref:Uncharacterized protein n=1 Tax=Apiospora rasikravindrae TaxID=990691 RepID=A0ABR1RY59_9PEZI